MDDKVTASQRLRHLQHYNQRSTRDQKGHPTRRLCQESNWPFTGDLTAQEIACMRDTYCGKRSAPSCIQPPRSYDSIHHIRPGWNQWRVKDEHQVAKDSQLSAKEEDKRRNVVVFGNSTYGHHIGRGLDFTYKDHARYHICKHQFSASGPITTLPPIKEPNSK